METFVRRVRHYGRQIVHDRAMPQPQPADVPASISKSTDRFLNPAIVRMNQRHREFWKRRKQ